MTTILCEPRPSASPTAPSATEEQHFFLPNITWSSYRVYKYWLNRFVETIAEELNRPIAPGGNMTLQRKDLEKGLEGDEVFWIEHEPHMRGKLAWDPELDPPPDLFLEIEVSRSVLDRLEICAGFRIPEVWSFDGAAIRIYQLQADGKYQITNTSRFFPEIPVGEIARFMDVEKAPDYLTAVKECRAWLRQILHNPPS